MHCSILPYSWRGRWRERERERSCHILWLEEPIESYRNLKPTRFLCRNQNFAIFHNISIIFLVPLLCSSLKISTLQQRISITSLLMSTFPVWTLLLVQQNLALLMDCPQNVSPSQWKLSYIQSLYIIIARFDWISICFPDGLSLPHTTLNKKTW